MPRIICPLLVLLWGCNPQPPGSGQSDLPVTPPSKTAHLAQTKAVAPPTKETTNEIVASIDLMSPTSQAALQLLPKERARVLNDPFYEQGELEFEGYNFKRVLGLVDGLDALDLKTHSLRFVCEDGYKTTYPFSAVKQKGAVLATLVREGDEFIPFPKIQRGKTKVSAGPLYLVWDGVAYGEKRPWPYQLTRIEVTSNQALAARWDPPSELKVGAGFKLFTKHCVACHAMNLKGGSMGPELNVPKNILSYRNREQLHAFIKNPQSFRSGSLMPPTGITDAELDQVLDYMAAMAHKQVCKTQQSCGALVQAAASAPDP